jgi:hypothetical protein
VRNRTSRWAVLRLVPVAALAATGLAATTGVASATGIHGSYTCSGGNVPAGVYRSMRVTGVCYTPSGNVTIQRSLTITPGALLDAVTAGDPTSGTPVVPATVDVKGNVYVEQGAALLFGCSPNITCSNPPGISYDRIGGNLTAYAAQGVVVHSATIDGNVSIRHGGGGAAANTCNSQTAGSPTVTNLEPWSEDAGLDFTPVYTDFEDVTVGGNLSVVGLNTCWLGSLRNQVGKNATYRGNRMGDPDGAEIANNVVHGNLACRNNSPAAQFGDSEAAPNLVFGSGFGECGFAVKLLNPAAEAGEGPAIHEHIAVPARRLRTHHGILASTSAGSLPAVTTSSGDTITADLYNFTLSGGWGLHGTGTVDPSQPPGSSGEAVLGTVYPNGSESFTAYLTCDCHFHGQSGTVGIRAYGTVSPRGFIHGWWLVTSGGGPVAGSLSTLAGGGKFSSAGEPAGSLRVTEHLAIT